jgi:hypothetical protein
MTELSFFGTLAASSLWCFGIYAVFNNDHILGPVADWLEKVTSVSFCRPIFGCPPCMASFHGGIMGLIAFGFNWAVIPFVICLCGLNFIIKTLIFEE